MRLRDGREVLLRPTRTSDTGALHELFYRLSEEDVESRFLQKLTSLTDTVAQYLCSVDYGEEMAYAVVIGPSAHERIVAASCYYLSPATRLAEVAYMVDPDWQGAGLGSILHSGLVEYARQHGARGLRADVLLGNARMMRVFEHGQHSLTAKTSGGVIELDDLLFVDRTDRRTDATANGYRLATRPGSKQAARPLPTSNAKRRPMPKGSVPAWALVRLAEPESEVLSRRSGRIQALSASAGGMPIEPGEQEITAAVEITFMLTPEPR